MIDSVKLQVILQDIPKLVEKNVEKNMVKEYLVRPLLDVLKVPTSFSVREMDYEVGDNYLDYGIRNTDGKMKTLIWVFGIRSNLESKSREIHNIFTKDSEVDIVIITNGVEYRFFLREDISEMYRINLSTLDFGMIEEKLSGLVYPLCLGTENPIFLEERQKRIEAKLTSNKDMILRKVHNILKEVVSDKISLTDCEYYLLVLLESDEKQTEVLPEVHLKTQPLEPELVEIQLSEIFDSSDLEFYSLKKMWIDEEEYRAYTVSDMFDSLNLYCKYHNIDCNQNYDSLGKYAVNNDSLVSKSVPSGKSFVFGDYRIYSQSQISEGLPNFIQLLRVLKIPESLVKVQLLKGEYSVPIRKRTADNTPKEYTLHELNTLLEDESVDFSIVSATLFDKVLSNPKGVEILRTFGKISSENRWYADVRNLGKKGAKTLEELAPGLSDSEYIGTLGGYINVRGLTLRNCLKMLEKWVSLAGQDKSKVIFMVVKDME